MRKLRALALAAGHGPANARALVIARPAEAAPATLAVVDAWDNGYQTDGSVVNASSPAPAARAATVLATRAATQPSPADRLTIGRTLSRAPGDTFAGTGAPTRSGAARGGRIRTPDSFPTS